MKTTPPTYHHSLTLLRRFIAAVLLLLFLFNLGGSYVVFIILQHRISLEIKAMIRNGMEDEELTVIVVASGSESDVSWIKPGKEFTLNGEMFDVVKSKTENGRILYYCINDRTEKKLITDFIHKGELMKKSRRLLTHANSIYIFQSASTVIIPAPTHHSFYNPEESFLSKIHEVPYPPPKCNILV